MKIVDGENAVAPALIGNIERFLMIKKRFREEIEQRIARIEGEASKLRPFAKELEDSEEKYAKLVENSPTGIYIDQGGYIVFANEKLANIYGYKRDELIGIESWKLVHPEDRPLTNDRRKKRIKGKKVASEYEARGLTKQGYTIWIRRRNTKIEYQGKPAILGNAVDISRQKMAEEELRKKNEQLKNFIRIISHDLKNPLIAVQGFSTRLLKHYGEKLGKKGKIYLEHILTSGHKMEELVSDLLTWANMGNIVYCFEGASSKDIIKRVIKELDHDLKRHDIEIVQEDSFPVLTCDEKRIYQVFLNLVSNAITYTGNTDSPRIEIGYRDLQKFHEFYVQDNGIGIEPKDQERIFEMFQRGKGGKGQEGIGLGLAIVQKIIGDHGGNVWVESEKNKGAIFYFTVPKNLTPQTKG